MKSVMRGTNNTIWMQALETQYSDEVTDMTLSAGGKDMLSVNLHHQLGAFQLAIQFQVPLGLIVLLGSSGAGKSLTLRSIAGLLHPRQGHIAVNEQVLFDSEAGTNVPAQLRHVGYVPQHYALFPHLTVAENILFALPPSRTNARWTQWRKQRASRRTRVAELLSILELDGLERRYPSTLSGGQQQRVALARALAAEPRLLLLDEPFNALDAAVRERLRDTLKQFQRRFAIPIVLVTHDHAEAQQLADTIVVVQHGQVAQTGSVNNIFYSPCSPDVAQLVGQHNVFTAILATPSNHPYQQKYAPSLALRLHHAQPTHAESSMALSQDNAGNEDHVNNWLPVPVIDLHPTASYDVGKAISGCIRTDEILIHRRVDSSMPPMWTAQGSVQWVGVLQEAQLYGHMMRLLIHPCLQGLVPDETFIAESTVEVYLSRGQWRDVEVASGQQLVLEIPPKAIHLFDIPTK
jgi:molybdate transport system ATP-binding protein